MISRGLHRGFSMIEAVAAVGLLAACVVTVLTAASGAVARREDARTRAVAASLVAEVLDEIRSLPYEDPSTPGGAIGPDAGETLVGRQDADDADDLHGWLEKGINDDSGSAIPGFGSLWRRVTVEWVSAADFATPTGVDSGVKRAMVQIERGGKVILKGTALITRAWEAATP
jgi:type II secretory pathway pseudopilin PulG